MVVKMKIILFFRLMYWSKRKFNVESFASKYKSFGLEFIKNFISYILFEKLKVNQSLLPINKYC